MSKLINLHDMEGNPTYDALLLIAKLTNGKLWVKNGKTRIYFDEGKKTTVYLNFEDGWSLNVYLEPCGQTPKWYANRKNDLKAQYKKAFDIAIGSYYFGRKVTEYSNETNEEFNRCINAFKDKWVQHLSEEDARSVLNPIGFAFVGAVLPALPPIKEITR